MSDGSRDMARTRSWRKKKKKKEKKRKKNELVESHKASPTGIANYIIDETYKNILKAAPSVDYDPEYASSKMYLNEMMSYLQELKTHNSGADNSKISLESFISGNKHQNWHTYFLDIALLIKPVIHLKKFQNSKWRPFFKMAATKYTEISFLETSTKIGTHTPFQPIMLHREEESHLKSVFNHFCLYCEIRHIQLRQ